MEGFWFGYGVGVLACFLVALAIWNGWPFVLGGSLIIFITLASAIVGAMA